jgi:putative ABC transport system substrate-binding protein
VKRREFIALLGGGAAAFRPLRAGAQGPERIPRVGALMPFAENDPNPTTAAIVPAFSETLGRLGWFDGRNIRIDYRFAAGNPALFKTYAAELVKLSPDAILASTPLSVIALREQSRKIPIVFVLVIDPVEQGFVQSIARPGGVITGFSFDPALMSKWLQLLKEIAPEVTGITVLFNPDTNTAANPTFSRAIQAAAPSFGITVTLAPVRDDSAIKEAIESQAPQPGGALIALPDPFNVAHGGVIVDAAIRRRLPLIGPPPLVPAGALMSYFFDIPDLYAQAASYIDRILKGASPADLPVQQPTKYSLVINLKTAKALGMMVPEALLARADEVLE